jgi:Flp pilus assembly protein TadG
VTPVSDRRRLGRRGSVILEFALIGPVVITLMVGIFELGMQLMTGAMLDYGVRMAARWGVTGRATPDGSTREAYIRSQILGATGGFLKTGQLSVTLTAYGSWANALGRTGATGGPGGSGAVVSYSVSYVQPVMTPPAVALLGRREFRHTGVLVVNNEPYPSL